MKPDAYLFPPARWNTRSAVEKGPETQLKYCSVPPTHLHLYIYVSMYLCIYLPIYLSIYLSIIYLHIYVSMYNIYIYISIYLIYLSLSLCVSPFLPPSFLLSLYRQLFKIFKNILPKCLPVGAIIF